MGSSNIIFDAEKKRVSGIIDFGQTSVDDPAIDIASLICPMGYGEDFIELILINRILFIVKVLYSQYIKETSTHILIKLEGFMRTEQEMMDLILDIARQDSRIRIMTIEGSRTNINIPNDEFQDYDVTYFVTDMEAFISNDEWLKSFGNIIMMQKPEDMELFLAEEKGFIMPTRNMMKI